ncbi:Prion-like-(Q/N-rich) domain-bearing protein [Dirofilaria immitis]
MATYYLSVITTVLLHFTKSFHSFDVPCTQKLIGSKCLFDEDCYGMNSVCREQRCTCPTNFEEFDIDGQTTICRLAPNKIGDSCQRDCKPPLLCRDGKCECWGGSIINGECVVSCPSGQQLYGVECQRVAHWGQSCENDNQCVDVFNACIAGICQCAPGTTRDVTKQRCFALCPDGTQPHQACRRLFINDIDMLENAASTDSCPLGYRCVAYGSPYVGHCCKLKCPYGEPDLMQSCDMGVAEKHRCRPLTHHCYTISEPGWKTSLCCPKPCRDPTPLYINNQCLSIAHREDPCQLHQQCEGGVTMNCILGICQCKDGFLPGIGFSEQYWFNKRLDSCTMMLLLWYSLQYCENDASNDGRFATCEKSCGIDEVAVMDKCVRRVQLAERCVTNKQCPNFSECRFGTCQCLCGYKQDSLIGSRCTNPDDPFSLNAILTGVEQVFGGKARNP